MVLSITTYQKNEEDKFYYCGENENVESNSYEKRYDHSVNVDKDDNPIVRDK